MSKARIITGAGIIAIGSFLSSMQSTNEDSSRSVKGEADKEVFFPKKDTITTLVKRPPTKVYHRFEEIPEISDEESFLYNKKEYTYIINADKYQKDGTIELKRVLKKELTCANLLSVMYRSECADYTPKDNEDQLVRYDIDLKLINSSGKYKGPSQMNDTGIHSFIKYLAANPKTRKYVLPLLKTKDGTNPETAAKNLEQNFFSPNGKILSMEEREDAISSPVYSNLTLKSNAWQTLASKKLKKFISEEEAKRHIRLSNTTKNYLCLTELFPNKQILLNSLEEYNLTFFPLARHGKPKSVMEKLAQNLNLTNTEGNTDATRLPTFVIAASISHINWQGNGLKALSDTKNKAKFIKNISSLHQRLRAVVKSWVSGKGKTYGIDELSKLNIITPKLITQYQQIELSGADDLAFNYFKEVAKAEENIENLRKQKDLADTKDSSDGTYILTPKEFTR